MVLISIFYTNQIHGDRVDCCSWFLSLHALALHLAVKILLQIFLYEDLGTCKTPHHRLYFPPEWDHLLTAPCLLSENIPNIWHKSSTKHKEVRPDWKMIKTIIPNYAPSLSHGRVSAMAQVPFLKSNSIKCEKFRLWIVLFWTKTSQRLTLYLLSSHR